MLLDKRKSATEDDVMQGCILERLEEERIWVVNTDITAQQPKS